MDIEQLKREFLGMGEHFNTMFENTDDREVKEMYSTYNLYEIEPFFSQLKNQSQEGATFLTDVDEYDPENDDLYLYHIDFEQRKTLFKRLVLGPTLSYDTRFEYGPQGYKSATLYIRDNFKKPISLSYLTFAEDRMPQVYTEVNEWGVMTKTYKTDGNMLTGYLFDFFNFEPNEHDFKTEVFFEYDAQGELAKIVEVRNTGFIDVLYTKYEAGQTLDWALQKIEDYLVSQIHQQIVATVHIEEEPVHTVLLEYCLQGPFPPTIGIGLASEQEPYLEQEPWMCYNAPDMLYFSERDADELGAIHVDLYEVEIQDAYKLVDRIYEEGEDLEGLQKSVYETYLKVIKRLSACDFSDSFVKTDSFVVMARDFDECNEERFYKDMVAYRNGANA